MKSLRLQGACQVTAAELALDPGQSDFWCWSAFWRPSKSGPRMSTLQGSLGIAVMKLLSVQALFSVLNMPCYQRPSAATVPFMLVHVQRDGPRGDMIPTIQIGKLRKDSTHEPSNVLQPV